MYTISFLAFIFHKAMSLRELLEGIIIISSFIVISIILYATVLQMTTIFELLDNVEKTIAISEWTNTICLPNCLFNS